eukprot:scaffold96014_cov45-Prasinocladus_malaysianus.AAC.1
MSCRFSCIDSRRAFPLLSLLSRRRQPADHFSLFFTVVLFASTTGRGQPLAVLDEALPRLSEFNTQVQHCSHTVSNGLADLLAIAIGIDISS